ncbi:MAG: hypothetical protein GKR92_07055 [Gammaproteobacteria bacterium]|nr:MAG: hypothetical protein GKR92_07055 [Gammaproteobacteria bacterium]
MYNYKLTCYKFLLVFLVLYFLIGSLAQAAWKFNWEAGVFLEHSDNIGRADTDEDDGTVLEPRVAILAIHEGPRLDAEIGVANEYRDHSSGVIGSNNNFNLDGVVDWKIMPNLLVWTFEDHFGSEFPVDIRDSPDEENRQDVNTFLTGPTFTPRIFSRTNLLLEGRYINTEAEETDIDNDRLQGKIGIQRDLTPNSSISINYLYEDTDFDEDTLDPTIGNIDFDRDNYFLEYNLARRSLDIRAVVGYSEIERDEGANRKSEGGGNNLLSISYVINSTSSLSLTAYDQFTDTTSDSSTNGEAGLGGGFGGIGSGGSTGVAGGIDVGDIAMDVTGDTVDTEGFVIDYSKRFSRIESSFSYFQSDDDHDLVNINDRETNGGTISFELPLNGTTTIGLASEYRETEFDVDSREDEDFLIMLSGEYHARRNLVFESTLEYQEKDSDAVGEDFDELVARIGFVYTNF